MGILLLAVIVMAANQTSAPADPPPASDLPVSVERIKEGLQRPTLKIPTIDPTPVFRATVEVDLPLDSPLQAMRRELAQDSGYSQKIGRDILPAIMGIVRGIRSAYRAHSEAEIRKEVQAEIDAFCAEHDCTVLEGPPPEGIVLPRKAR